VIGMSLGYIGGASLEEEQGGTSGSKVRQRTRKAAE